MDRLLGEYQNGNYTVRIYNDGTKIRFNDLDYFEPDTVESFDLKITNKCDMGCPMCHENSTPEGEHGDLMNLTFLETLHPYTEIAIGGGNPLCHPQLLEFLKYCKGKKFLPSMTINQVHFEKEFDFVEELVKKELIYGLGISLVSVTPQFIEKVKKFPNAVIHIINGLVSEEQLQLLKNNNLKILILGYKEVRRGENLYKKEAKVIENKKSMLKNLLPTMVKERWFNVISFDNLAINQLDVKSLMSEDAWKVFYMGDDGMDGALTSSTMFIDAVTGKFALNSCSMDRYPLMNTIEDMYKFLKSKIDAKNLSTV